MFIIQYFDLFDYLSRFIVKGLIYIYNLIVYCFSEITEFPEEKKNFLKALLILCMYGIFNYLIIIKYMHKHYYDC